MASLEEAQVSSNRLIAFQTVPPSCLDISGIRGESVVGEVIVIAVSDG